VFLWLNLAPCYLAGTLWSAVLAQWVLASVFGGGDGGGSPSGTSNFLATAYRSSESFSSIWGV
jgi:hypothetical protein